MYTEEIAFPEQKQAQLTSEDISQTKETAPSKTRTKQTNSVLNSEVKELIWILRL